MAATFRAVRDETIFGCCKWDPQVGDVSVLHDTPLILRRNAWCELSSVAEALAEETIAAERELRAHTDLHGHLGLDAGVRRALRTSASHPAEAPFRVLRFDFHWTHDGWKVSEVNSDVPGGFIEASGFTALMSAHVSGASPAGDPAAALVDAIARRVSRGARIGLVHATGYSDDRQVMVYLAALLRRHGLEPMLVSPSDVAWTRDGARARNGKHEVGLDVVHRFFPAEWLPNLGFFQPWRAFFRANVTAQINPPSALFTQSKRFPLVWDALATPLPTWRRYMPATCDPRARTGPVDEWVLKPALGRVGDGVDVSDATPSDERARIHKAARRHPDYWAAQRRFEAVPWSTAAGPLYPAVGVYVIDGRAAGVYTRAAPRPLIDARAFDVATLIEDPEPLF